MRIRGGVGGGGDGMEKPRARRNNSVDDVRPAVISSFSPRSLADKTLTARIMYKVGGRTADRRTTQWDTCSASLVRQHLCRQHARASRARARGGKRGDNRAERFMTDYLCFGICLLTRARARIYKWVRAPEWVFGVAAHAASGRNNGVLCVCVCVSDELCGERDENGVLAFFLSVLVCHYGWMDILDQVLIEFCI